MDIADILSANSLSLQVSFHWRNTPGKYPSIKSEDGKVMGCIEESGSPSYDRKWEVIPPPQITDDQMRVFLLADLASTLEEKLKDLTDRMPSTIVYISPGQVAQTKGPFHDSSQIKPFYDEMKKTHPPETKYYLVWFYGDKEFAIDQLEDWILRGEAYEEHYEEQDKYIKAGVCSQCGAKSAKEAEKKCTASQDHSGEYTCSGDDLWPEKEPIKKVRLVVAGSHMQFLVWMLKLRHDFRKFTYIADANDLRGHRISRNCELTLLPQWTHRKNHEFVEKVNSMATSAIQKFVHDLVPKISNPKPEQQDDHESSQF